MSIRLDEVNKRIIHALMQDARKTSAPMIADEVGVSPATIRNRIQQLEDAGIFRGYHANVDFERADGLLTTLYNCTAPVDDRHKLSQQVREISGVINVRELFTGRENLHILVVGKDLDDLQEVARKIVSLGVEIEDEGLMRSEKYQGYQPFGPGETQQRFSDYISLTGGSEVVEITVPEEAPITNITLEQAGREGLLEDEVLVVSIERDEEILTPQGKTEIKAGDLLTVLSRNGITEPMLKGFRANDE